MFQVLADDEPAAPVAPAADAQSPALAQRVVGKADVLADLFAVFRPHNAGLHGQKALQKLP